MTRYSYDVRGNLLPGVTQSEYVADAMNRRVARKVNGVVTQRFVYTGALSPAAEVDANGAVITRFVYGTHVNVPDYFVRGGVTYRVITDHLAACGSSLTLGQARWRSELTTMRTVEYSRTPIPGSSHLAMPDGFWTKRLGSCD